MCRVLLLVLREGFPMKQSASISPRFGSSFQWSSASEAAEARPRRPFSTLRRWQIAMLVVCVGLGAGSWVTLPGSVLDLPDAERAALNEIRTGGVELTQERMR